MWSSNKLAPWQELELLIEDMSTRGLNDHSLCAIQLLFFCFFRNDRSID